MTTVTTLRATAQALLRHTLDDTSLPFAQKSAGKVRDSYMLGDERLLVTTDRISAFDHILGTIPLKGQVLNQLAGHWLQRTAHLAPNHLVEVIDASAMVVKNCQPLKAEFVMRGYLTGTTETSILRNYERGVRTFCGHDLPDGLAAHGKLPHNILTPTTKGDAGLHDVNMSSHDIVASGAVDAAHFAAAAEMAADLFAFGQKEAAKRGLILADTKYEFGLFDGQVILIDEVHTPDSSRYWHASDYQERMDQGLAPRSLDKEFVRRWMVDTHGFRGDGLPPRLDDTIRVDAALRYIENYEWVTGETFVPSTEEPNQRIAAAVTKYCGNEVSS